MRKPLPVEMSAKDGDLVTQRYDPGFEGRLRPKQGTKDADQHPQHWGGALLQAEARPLIAVRM